MLSITIKIVFEALMRQLAKTVGMNIRTERKTRKLSQDALAFACGIDRSYMGRIERGEVNITIDKLYTIANILACKPSALLPDSDTTVSITSP